MLHVFWNKDILFFTKFNKFNKMKMNQELLNLREKNKAN
jgi:hypothetical protein